MTDDRLPLDPVVTGDAVVPDDPEERAAEARRVADRLRRRKAALERRNPLNDLDGYRERFREVIQMEAQLRRLRADDPSTGDG